MATDTHGMGIPLPADSTKIHEFPKVARASFEKVAEVLAGGMTDGAEALVKTLTNAAMDEEIAARSLMETEPLPLEEAAWAMVDEAGRRSWLEIGADGAPTSHSAAIIAGAVVQRIKAGALLPLPAEVDTTAAVWGITDAAGRRSWLEIGADGRPTEHARKLIFEGYGLDPTPEELAPENTAEVTGTAPNRRLYVNNGYTGARHLITAAGDPRNAIMTRDNHVIFDTDAGRMHSAIPSAGVFPAVGTTELAFFGDSLTDSGPDDIYPKRVAALTGLPVYHGGVSGQASGDIAIRQGGLRPALTLAGDTIPAGTTPVTVRAIAPATGYRQNGTGSFAFGGTLRGVFGTLEHDLVTDAWTFTRTTAGAAVACPPGSRFTARPEWAAANENKIQIIWAGRNNMTAGATLADARRDIAAMVAYLKPYHKRFLVLGVLNATNETKGSTRYLEIVEHNAILADTYGPLFFDIRRPFIDRGLTLAKIPATNEDLTAMDKDAPPPSLMDDSIHPSFPAGATVLGDLVADVITTKGWHL